eukprot:9289557-Ditylum_brightwellii.AAC.1
MESSSTALRLPEKGMGARTNEFVVARRFGPALCQFRTPALQSLQSILDNAGAQEGSAGTRS